jgi:hypothetical protein
MPLALTHHLAKCLGHAENRNQSKQKIKKYSHEKNYLFSLVHGVLFT